LSFLTRFRRPSEARATARENPSGGRRALSGLITALAGVLVVAALIVPNRMGGMTPGAFLRIPVEALVGAGLLLIVPARVRNLTATLIGVGIGLLTLLKLIDIGFYEVLARQFDPVFDWTLADDGYGFLTDSFGTVGAIGAALAVVALASGVPLLMALAVRRLTRVMVGHRPAALRAGTAVTAVWVALALLGVQIVPGVAVASRSAGGLTYHRALQIRAGLQDHQKFAEAAAVDAFRDARGDELLTALRGKDVIFSFIESYGRSAVQDPDYATQVGAVLDDGTKRLQAKGFAAQTGFLTSSTAGGNSWLAHATFHSGLWVDNQQRYRSLVSSDRLTLTSAFRRAQWRTVGVEPGITYAWPEGAFYGYDKVYDSRNIGYNGPTWSWATMPDQFTMAAFQRLEHARKDRAPLFAEISLVSSHTPWAPIPSMIDWADVGDGSVYGPMAKAGASVGEIWSDTKRVRAEYRRSIEYSLTTLIEYMENYGDANTVMVFLGDHQPAPVITGDKASHDVPVTIVAKDPAVMAKIAPWGWQDGLKPGPQAPVWPMDTFRDRFLTAFGGESSAAQALSRPTR
jgi:hypothetical protein